MDESFILTKGSTQDAASCVQACSVLLCGCDGHDGSSTGGSATPNSTSVNTHWMRLDPGPRRLSAPGL